MYKHFFKRLIDFSISFIFTLILLPLFLFISILIKLDSRGPVFFRQERLGKNGKVFKIYKFRSMVVNAEHTGSGVYSNDNDKRITKVGKILRKTSLDEIPQLLNILKGDMSFIGPRPPLTYHPWKYEEYTDVQKQMFLVRPGITGYTQVNGRKDVEWHRRIMLNVWYANHVSFILDIKIIFKTVFKVFSNADNENKGETLFKNGLKLMYITNNPKVAVIAENSGVDRVFVDMEYIGKSDRQGGMDTVQSHHTLEDIAKIKSVVKKAKVLARINPIHDATSEYCSSKEEIDGAIKNGADIIMLPFFKTKKEVEKFVSLVDGRAKTMLLVETAEAVDVIDDILSVSGIDEMYIGLNDLSLSKKQKFMFIPLADGTVDNLIEKFKAKNIPFGFGGIAALGKGDVPADMIIPEHYRLGSSSVILSRSFCNTSSVSDYDKLQEDFLDNILAIRALEEKCLSGDIDFMENRKIFTESVDKVVKRIK